MSCHSCSARTPGRRLGRPIEVGDAWIAATALLWLTDAWHHLSPAIPALMAAIVLLAPRIGALTCKQFGSKQSGGLILTVGASMSLARTMIDTGAASWLGAAFVDRLTSIAVAPAAIVVLLVIAVALIAFNQEWHVEEERPIGSGEDYGAAPPDEGAPQPA